MDQHILVDISVNGNSKVAFSTNFGWANNLSISIDAVDSGKAIRSAVEFLESFGVVPFENCCGNEEFVVEAKEAISIMLSSIIDLTDLSVVQELTSVFPAVIEVKFTPYYTVEFGE